MHNRSICRAGVILGVFFFAVGCSAPERRSESSSASAETPIAQLEPRTAVRVFDREGQPTTWSAMLADMSGADVIVIGETHGHELGLSAAAALWDDVLAAHTNSVLAMEFFERDQQIALDDYLAGVTDEEAFREAARRREGNYPPGHQRMVEAAREAGRPVIAANAPRRYVRMTTPEGYERLHALSDEQRRLFNPPVRLSEGKYRDDFVSLMSGGGHGAAMSDEMVNKIYYSQQLWDSTMAESVVSATMRGEQPVVLVVGRFHSDFGGATVEFIERARPDLTIRVVSVVDTASDTIEDDDIGRADFVFYVGTDDGDGT